MEDEAYLLDSKRSKEKDDMAGIANLVCPDNENERPALSNSFFLGWRKFLDFFGDQYGSLWVLMVPDRSNGS